MNDEWTGEWTVTITVTTGEAVAEELLDTFADTAEEWDATVATRGTDGSGFTFRVDLRESSPLRALETAQTYVAKVLAEAGVTGEPVAMSVETPALAELRAFRPDTPELLAATDVAEVLDVSRQRVHQLYASHRLFPEPYVRLGSGPVWTRPVIEHFASIWDRKPGRRAKAS
jgi:hypothetical protein